MGTFVSVSLPDDHLAHADSVFSVFREVDDHLSSYKASSEVSRLNRDGGGEMSSLTEQCLVLAMHVANETGGHFDPTLGALTLETYKFGSGKVRSPTTNEIEAARKRVGFGNAKMEGPRLHLASGMKLDLGGIGKGFAVDLAATRLRSEGVSEAVIAASGDIRCLHSCQAAIAHPRDAAKTLASFVAIGDELAISTSGTSENRGPGTIHHLLNAVTGRPAQEFLSVTLLSQGGNTLLDGMATGVSTMAQSGALAFLRRRPHLGYVLVTNQGEVLYNSRLKELVKELHWLTDGEFKLREIALKQ